MKHVTIMVPALHKLNNMPTAFSTHYCDIMRTSHWIYLLHPTHLKHVQSMRYENQETH